MDSGPIESKLFYICFISHETDGKHFDANGMGRGSFNSEPFSLFCSDPFFYLLYYVDIYFFLSFCYFSSQVLSSLAFNRILLF